MSGGDRAVGRRRNPERLDPDPALISGDENDRITFERCKKRDKIGLLEKETLIGNVPING